MAEYYCLSRFDTTPRTEARGDRNTPRIEALCRKFEARDADAAKGWGAYFVTDPLPAAFADPGIILVPVDRTQLTAVELARLRPVLKAEFGVTLPADRELGRDYVRALLVEKGFK